MKKLVWDNIEISVLIIMYKQEREIKIEKRLQCITTEKENTTPEIETLFLGISKLNFPV